MNYYSYANGKIIKKDNIKIGISDLVMLRGYGVFDYMRTYAGKPFLVHDYISRFSNSAKEMKLKLPLSNDKIEKIIYTLLKKNQKKNQVKEFGIRFLLTGGYSLDSFLPSIKPNLFILIEDTPHYPDWWLDKGVKLITYSHVREMPVVKTINYLTAIHQADVRRSRKAQDTLYVAGGKLLETTRNNFFLFNGNTLVTPSENVLKGITRNLILKLAKKKYKIEVRDVKVSELKKCSECFITGTTRGITPVIQIDNLKIGNGVVGENTKELMNFFWNFVETQNLKR